MKLKYRNTWLGIGWGLVLLIFYLSLTPTPPRGFDLWDKLNHFLGYGGIMLWFGQVYQGTISRVLFAVYFIIIGACIEVLQGMGGVRFFEYNDMLANSVGVVCALLVLSYNAGKLFYWVEKRVLNVS